MNYGPYTIEPPTDSGPIPMWRAKGPSLDTASTSEDSVRYAAIQANACYQAGMKAALTGIDDPAAFVARAKRMEAALTKIAATQDCGCRPCRGQCDSHAALKMWIEEAQDLARTALSNAAKVE